jgi:glycosyltransferase involved in cell wall biosynthesis
MISFFTWIHNRTHQFRDVLPLNLERADRDCEFAILDIASDDGLIEFIQPFAADPRITYRRDEEVGEIHFAKLYNRAAALCRGDILVCLDADNVIGPEFCLAALEWCTERSFMWASDFDWGGGTIGRVGMAASVFWQLGGYDESLGPVGYQDIDLIQRAKAFGLRCRHLRDPEIVGHAIRNTKSDTVKAMGMTKEDYLHTNSRNQAISKANIAAGRLVANLAREY